MAGTGWLRDSVIYQIFMPSFGDGDGDGIGDLQGAIAHLDHLEWLGIDAVWFNPCFVSPFRDAGYDVADYLTIAPRYGTNDDMAAFIAEARRRGIRVLLDLVAGHTSVRHPWFQASASDTADDRYIWSDRPGPGFVPSPGRRPGYYLKNFFDEQPALNFGYARADDAEPWRQPTDAPGPKANRDALGQIMAYWLDRGVAGFRVDMAYSLVKDDPDFAATVALWADLRAWVQARYPDAVLLPEGDYRLAPGMGSPRRIRRRLLPGHRASPQPAVQQRRRRNPAAPAGAPRLLLRRERPRPGRDPRGIPAQMGRTPGRLRGQAACRAAHR